MGGNQGVSSRCVREAMRRVAVNMNGRRGPKLGTSPFTHLVGELLAHGHRRARELDDTSVPDEGGHQGGQRPSMAIRAHQSSSEAIRAHQRPSAHPSLGCRAPKLGRQSELIRGHRRTPPAAAARPKNAPSETGDPIWPRRSRPDAGRSRASGPRRAPTSRWPLMSFDEVTPPHGGVKETPRCEAT